MSESAELGHKIDKATCEKEVPELREALLDAQFDLVAEKNFEVIIPVGGVDGAGRSETVNLLNEWMDPRHIEVHGMGEASDEERERPPMWRFWRALPPKGKIGIFMGSWYTWPIPVERVEGFCPEADWMRAYGEINDFEDQLARHDTVAVKFWLATSKDEQMRRFKEREKTGFKRYKITEEDWRNRKKLDQYERAVCDMVERTSTDCAPWTLIESKTTSISRASRY